MSNDLTTIRQMCADFDVTARTLRFYETEGLLAPARHGTVRWYGPSDRARLKLTLRGKHYGLSIKEIRALLDLYDPANGNLTQIRAIRDTGQRQLAVLREQRETLDAAITDLRDEIATAESAMASHAG